jgi:DNA topoisomerase VI subunit B
MDGISTRCFRMFRELCGDHALQNVVIVTIGWGEVDPWVGEAREAELASEDMFFKPVLGNGARMARHEDTVPSAERILRLILENHPLPLRIQEELVDEWKHIGETTAGEELHRELDAQIRKREREVEALTEDMQQAMRDQDEETKKELEIETERIEEEIERLRNDSMGLGFDSQKERERIDARMRQVESEAEKEAERVAAQYQKQIDNLCASLRNNPALDSKKARMLIEELQRKNTRNPRSNFFSRIGDALNTLVP